MTPLWRYTYDLAHQWTRSGERRSPVCRPVCLQWLMSLLLSHQCRNIPPAYPNALCDSEDRVAFHGPMDRRWTINYQKSRFSFCIHFLYFISYKPFCWFQPALVLQIRRECFSPQTNDRQRCSFHPCWKTHYSYPGRKNLINFFFGYSAFFWILVNLPSGQLDRCRSRRKWWTEIYLRVLMKSFSNWNRHMRAWQFCRFLCFQWNPVSLPPDVQPMLVR